MFVPVGSVRSTVGISHMFPGWDLQDPPVDILRHISLYPPGKAFRGSTITITGDPSKQGQILLVKIGKYIVFRVYRRSY